MTPANGALTGLSAPSGCSSPGANTTSSIFAKTANINPNDAVDIIVHASALLYTGAGLS